MDQALRDEVKHLRSLSSPEAFALLTHNRPTLSRAIIHRSWAVQEQEALLNFYLPGKLPHATDRGYKWLIQATSLSRMIRHVTKLLPSIPNDGLDLLEYYLRPTFYKAAQTARQKGKHKHIWRN